MATGHAGYRTLVFSGISFPTNESLAVPLRKEKIDRRGIPPPLIVLAVGIQVIAGMRAAWSERAAYEKQQRDVSVFLTACSNEADLKDLYVTSRVRTESSDLQRLDKEVMRRYFTSPPPSTPGQSGTVAGIESQEHAKPACVSE